MEQWLVSQKRFQNSTWIRNYILSSPKFLQSGCRIIFDMVCQLCYFGMCKAMQRYDRQWIICNVNIIHRLWIRIKQSLVKSALAYINYGSSVDTTYPYYCKSGYPYLTIKFHINCMPSDQMIGCVVCFSVYWIPTHCQMNGCNLMSKSVIRN